LLRRQKKRWGEEINQMKNAKMKELADLGQSLWFDYISRSLMQSGQLQEFIDQGLRGMTSNPTIFHNAVSQSADYDVMIKELADAGKTTFEIYDALTICDIQQAADLLWPVYQQTNALDGYVSLEINPRLAHNTAASIEEGKRLFQTVGRKNIMIKVPATDAGFPVIEELLASGINVNVTLIFSLRQYQETVEAYFQGMREAYMRRQDLSSIRSAASVFVSRIDTAVDQMLKEKSEDALKGKAAIANARLVFQRFEQLFGSEEYRHLKNLKAAEQRVLWASTGTKNPAYSDIKYIEELIVRPTVNTAPEKTLRAFLDHGRIRDGFSAADFPDARKTIDALSRSGISVDAVCRQLLDDGVAAFQKSFDELLNSIEDKVKTLCPAS
jgi:transaldolase